MRAPYALARVNPLPLHFKEIFSYAIRNYDNLAALLGSESKNLLLRRFRHRDHLRGEPHRPPDHPLRIGPLPRRAVLGPVQVHEVVDRDDRCAGGRTGTT